MAEKRYSLKFEGKKVYVVVDSMGLPIRVESYKIAHGQDIRRKAKAEK